MCFKIPIGVQQLLCRLNTAGYKAYLAGGCVRDTLLGVPPTDYDIATNATTDTVQELFCDMKVVPTGIKHGTVTVINGKTVVEITTFRKDGVYTDCRHPDSVSFSQELGDDAARRDFTVNAMYYSEDRGIIDLYGGISDLNGKILRAVGTAKQRFAEDALRILRGLRFAARLGFEIEKETEAAMYSHAWLLKNIAVERVLAELAGLFKSVGCGEQCAKHLPLFVPILGSPANPKESFGILSKQSESFRLAAFFALYGGENANRLIASLKPDKEKLLLVSAAVDAAYGTALQSNGAVAECVNKYGISVYADMLSFALSLNLNISNSCFAILNGLKNSSIPCNIQALAVNGTQLMNMGIPQGKDIGDVLRYLYIETFNGVENKKQVLLQAARSYYFSKRKGS